MVQKMSREIRLCSSYKHLGQMAAREVKTEDENTCSPMCNYMNLQEYCFLFKADVGNKVRSNTCKQMIMILEDK